MAQIETTRQLLEQEMKKKTPAQELEDELAGMRERGEVRAHTHTNTHTHNHTHTHPVHRHTPHTLVLPHGIVAGLLQDLLSRLLSSHAALLRAPLTIFETLLLLGKSVHQTAA